MDREELTEELSAEDLEGVNGGVIPLMRKHYLKTMVRHEKRTVGNDLDTVLEKLKYDPEQAEYVRSIWDQN